MEATLMSIFIFSLCAFSYKLGKLRGIKKMRRVMSRQRHPSYTWGVTGGTESAKIKVEIKQ